MTKAMYALSGDPITYGHIDVISRAARDFDEVVVGIGVNPDKKYTFSLEERLDMAQKALGNLDNVRVTPFNGLLVDYAYENNISAVIKGVRNSADFDYENLLHQVGDSQRLGIETYVLFARPELAHISSSMIKAVQKEQGLVHEYVPLHVKQALEGRISGQYVVGVTGEIGAGKSYVSDKFVELGKQKGLEVHNIDMDKIGHNILGSLKEPRYEQVRKEIGREFGDVLSEDGSVDRKKLGEAVFRSGNALKKLNEIMHTPILTRTRKEMYGKKGLILLNGALILEAGMSYLCNNNIVLVYADEDSQMRRLRERGLSDEQIRLRVFSQGSFLEKEKILGREIDKHNQGQEWVVGNWDGKNDGELSGVLDRIKTGMGVK